MTLIAPSMLSANFANLEKDCQFVNESKADWFHLDVMDGTFVPNISFGFPVIEAIARNAHKPLDAHLMVINPQNWISKCKDLGVKYMSVHYEACPHLHRTLQQIKDAGMKAGVALNPHTNVSLIEDVLCDVDFVLIMSVNPGFGGQKFIPNALNKVAKLKEMRDKGGFNFLIEVDGGVTPLNAKALSDAGADVLVAGSAVFKADNPNAAIDSMKD